MLRVSKRSLGSCAAWPLLDLEYSVYTSGRTLEREYFGLLCEYLLTGPLPPWDAGDACEFQHTGAHSTLLSLQRYATH
jgi:hypothetical protein